METIHLSWKVLLVVASLVLLGSAVAADSNSLNDTAQGPKVFMLVDISISTGDSSSSPRQVAYSLAEDLPNNTQVGLIAYNTEAYMASNIRPISENRDELKNKISKLNPSGNTFHHVGLEAANNVLNGTGNIVLITDGRITDYGENVNTTRNSINAVNSTETKLIAVGAGDNKNEEFLKNLASNASGYYLDAEDSSSLQFTFQAPVQPNILRFTSDKQNATVGDQVHISTKLENNASRKAIETVTLYVNSSRQVEHTKKLTIPANSSKTWNFSYKFEHGQTGPIELKVKAGEQSASTTVDVSTLERKFKKGWNYISLPIADRSNPEISEVFNHMDNIESIWTYNNGKWQNYNPDAPDNSFTTMKGGRGYIVKASDNFTVRPIVHTRIHGENPNEATPASEQIEQGWNLVGHYWIEEKLRRSALGSIPEEQIASAYTPEKHGLSLTKLGKSEAMQVGNAYWVLSSKDAVYGKSQLTSKGRTLDWSNASVYQMDEKVETDNYQVYLKRATGELRTEYTDVRRMKFFAYYENKDVPVTQAFNGIQFEHELVFESGEVKDLGSVSGLRKNQSQPSSIYRNYYSVSKEILASKKPKYLRITVKAENKPIEYFKYDVSDYLKWRIPDYRMEVEESEILGHETIPTTYKKLEVENTQKDQQSWGRTNKTAYQKEVEGQLYIANTTELYEELNISNEDVRPHNVRNILRSREREGKPSDNLSSFQEICTTNVSYSGDYSCNLTDQLEDGGTYFVNWRIERKDNLDKEVGFTSFRAAEIHDYNKTVNRENYSIGIDHVSKTQSGDSYHLSTQLNFTNISSKSYAQARIKTGDGKVITGEGFSFGDVENFTKTLEFIYDADEVEQGEIKFITIEAGDTVPVTFNISNVSESSESRNMHDIGKKANFSDFSYKLDYIYLSNATQGFELKAGSTLENKDINSSVAPDGISANIKAHTTSDEELSIYGPHSVYKNDRQFREGTESVSPGIELDYVEVEIRETDQTMYYNVSKNPPSILDHMGVNRTYELGDLAANEDIEVNFTSYSIDDPENGWKDVSTEVYARNKNLSKTTLSHTLLDKNGAVIEDDNGNSAEMHGPWNLRQGYNATDNTHTTIPKEEDPKYILSKLNNDKPIFLFNIETQQPSGFIECSSIAIEIMNGSINSTTIKQSVGDEPIGEVSVTWSYEQDDSIQNTTAITEIGQNKTISHGLDRAIGNSLDTITAKSKACDGVEAIYQG